MMKKGVYTLLSYSLKTDMPLYPGTPKTKIRQVKDIRKGDSCNKYLVTFSNHSGTHVDGPAHFFAQGRKISSYGIRELTFRRPAVCTCPKEKGEPVTVSDLQKTKGLAYADALLIRTGFSQYRNKRAFRTYCFKGPYLSVEAAMWLRKNYPGIRAIGIDCISVSSYTNRAAGRETHQVLLRDKGFKGAPLLLIEDINLEPVKDGIDDLILAPLVFQGLDSAPCTVIGIKHG